MRRLRSFCGAFTVTLCVLGLGAGLLTAGYRSHRMTEGELTGSYRFENGVLLLTDSRGNTVRLAPPAERASHTALLPAPLRVCAHGLRLLAAAAEKLSERLT